MEKLVRITKVFTLKTICKIIVLINQFFLDIQIFNKIKLYKTRNYLSDVIDINKILYCLQHYCHTKTKHFISK